MNNDRSFTSSPEPEVIPMDVRGYTFRRKIAIVVWLSLLTATVAITYLLFQLVGEGADYFVHVQLQLMSNLAFGHSDFAFNIPLLRPLRAIFFALSVFCGVKALLKLFIPPPIRTHKVVIHHFPHTAEE